MPSITSKLSSIEFNNVTMRSHQKQYWEKEVVRWIEAIDAI